MSAGSGATKRAINLPRPAFWTRPAHFLSPDRDPSAGPLPPPHRDAALTQIVRSSCGPSGMRPAFVLPPPHTHRDAAGPHRGLDSAPKIGGGWGIGAYVGLDESPVARETW